MRCHTDNVHMRGFTQALSKGRESPLYQCLGPSAEHLHLLPSCSAMPSKLWVGFSQKHKQNRKSMCCPGMADAPLAGGVILALCHNLLLFCSFLKGLAASSFNSHEGQRSCSFPLLFGLLLPTAVWTRALHIPHYTISITVVFF